jgi:regulator of protease activity HflC (stomatin/prohibitin superfamily)
MKLMACSIGEITAIYLLIMLFFVILFAATRFKKITIFEHLRGLKYVRGKFSLLLEPGQYWIYPGTTSITHVDIRPRFITITGQELLTSDGISIKVSLAARYEVSDPVTAINKVENYNDALYLTVQLALREIAGAVAIDDLLKNRGALNDQLMEKTSTMLGDYGLKLHEVKLKDIMFPGELKKVFSQVISARNEGLAALERARGETAALRSLANVARLIEKNPSLMQLRVVQSIEGSKGNTVILGMPPPMMPLPLRERETGGSSDLPDPQQENGERH